MQPIATDADVSVSMTGPPVVAAGEVLAYTVRGQNLGPATASNVVMTVPLPAGATLESVSVIEGSASCSSSSSTVTCTVSSLVAVPTSASYFSVRVEIRTPDQLGSLGVSASIVADEFDPVPSNNSANFTTQRLVGISIGDAAAFEGDAGAKTVIRFPITLARPVSSPVAVRWRIVTETAGDLDIDDRNDRVGTATFNPSPSTGFTPVSKTVSVAIRPDQIDESDETFRVELLFNGGPAAIADPVGVGTVLDDDPGTGQRIGIGSVSVREGDAGMLKVPVVVTLRQPASGPVTFTLNNGGGTAVPGVDYKPLSKTSSKSFTINAGQSTKIVMMTIFPDQLDEPDRTVLLTITSVSGASVVGSGVGTITIVDDD